MTDFDWDEIGLLARNNFGDWAADDRATTHLQARQKVENAIESITTDFIARNEEKIINLAEEMTQEVTEA